MLHKTSQERYEKLHAQFISLMRHFDIDGLDDYIQTANSLTDWIRRDQNLSQDQRDEIDRFTMPNGIDWQICNQIANYQKHGGPASPRRKSGNSPSSFVVKNALVKEGGSAGVVFPFLKMRTFGAGDEIRIEYECDGRNETEDAFSFVYRSFKFFHYIFELAPITSIPDRLKAQNNWAEILARD
jgi:hypothetical protein